MNVVYHAPAMSVSVTVPAMGISTGKPIVKEYRERDPYTGDYNITATESTQVLDTDGKRMLDDVVVDAIPSDYVGSAVTRRDSDDVTASGKTITAPAGFYSENASKSVADAVWHGSSQISKNPTISVDENGLITASYSASSNMKPIKTDGWAEASHVFPIAASGSKTLQLTARSSSDMSVSGATVTAPAGYYGEPASASVPNATVSGSSSMTANPVLSVDYDTGEITATVSSSKTIAPISAAGYADTSASHVVTVGGNAATQLYTKSAQTWTPNKTDTIQIASGQLLTGDQTILPIPTTYYDMSGDLAWMGKDAQLVSENWYKKVDTLDNTGLNGWTPSTTAKTCVATVTLSDAKFTATDVADWAYFIVWECGVDIAYTGSPTLKALPTFARALIVQNLVKRPNSWTAITNSTSDGTVNQAAYTASMLRYYGTTTGTLTYTWAASYGLYFTATAPTISSATAASPTITPKTPLLMARTSTTYMSATSCNAIDQGNSKWWILGSKIYRARRDCFFDGIYKLHNAVINSTAPSSS